MTPCSGFIGDIFGHKFRQYMVKETPPADMRIQQSYRLEDTIEALTAYEYIVVCERCWAKSQ
jgi:hypothetical protein